MKRVTVAAGACALGLMLFTPSRAWAGNEAAAEALFMEAKKLASQGKYAEACPKFAESNKLDRGAGTLIHLGDCYEKNKQLASAWATYKEAASAAQALGRKDWEKLAGQRAGALEPKLARITIKVDKANEDKVEVSRDGTVVSPASWGMPIPVDVGSHAVEASGAGKKPFKTTIVVSRDGERADVSVPALEAEPGATPPPPATLPPTPEVTPKPAPPDADRGGDGGGQRTLGLALGGVGLVGVAVGAVTGLMAMGKSNDAKNDCPADGGCASQGAVDASDSAKTLGLVSTIGFIAGGAMLAAGVTLFLTAPSARKTGVALPAVRVAPSGVPGGAGLTALGVF